MNAKNDLREAVETIGSQHVMLLAGEFVDALAAEKPKHELREITYQICSQMHTLIATGWHLAE